MNVSRPLPVKGVATTLRSSPLLGEGDREAVEGVSGVADKDPLSQLR